MQTAIPMRRRQKKGHRYGKKFSLGDNVRVKLARVNAFRSEIDFEMAQMRERGLS